MYFRNRFVALQLVTKLRKIGIRYSLNPFFTTHTLMSQTRSVNIFIKIFMYVKHFEFNPDRHTHTLDIITISFGYKWGEHNFQ